MACRKTRYPLLPMMFVCTLKTINLPCIHKIVIKSRRELRPGKSSTSNVVMLMIMSSKSKSKSKSKYKCKCNRNSNNSNNDNNNNNSSNSSNSNKISPGGSSAAARPVHRRAGPRRLSLSQAGASILLASRSRISIFRYVCAFLAKFCGELQRWADTILAIFYPPLKSIRGCFGLILQTWKGNIYFTELAERVEFVFLSMP